MAVTEEAIRDVRYTWLYSDPVPLWYPEQDNHQQSRSETWMRQWALMFKYKFGTGERCDVKSYDRRSKRFKPISAADTDLWDVDMNWLRWWVTGFSLQLGEPRSPEFIDTMLRGLFARIRHVCTSDEEYERFEAKVECLKHDLRRQGLNRELDTTEVVQALWPLLDSTMQLKQEALEEMKYVSVETDLYGQYFPAGPRDSVEPPSYSSGPRNTDERHYGQLRSTDELAYGHGGFRGTDEPVIKAENIRGDESPFIKHEYT